MILVVFHTAGINERKKKGKKKISFWYRTWMGYCPIELRAGRWGAGALGRVGVGAGALGWALGERACGRRRACVGARVGATGS